MKNYLVIGGSSGIGLALTNLLANEGNRVFATYNKHIRNNTNPNIEYYFLDVLDDHLDLDFVPDQLHGIAYCPGSINLKPFKRTKPEAFLDDYKLQVLGAVKVLQNVMPKLLSTEQASVVLFSTIAVKMGLNFHSQVATSKGALEGLTRSLAAEWAPKIRVNTIAPSLTDTPLASKLLNTEEKKKANAERHPLKKVGSPTDIAEMASFLLSSKSGWMTGQIIHLDGGMSAIK